MLIKQSFKCPICGKYFETNIATEIKNNNPGLDTNPHNDEIFEQTVLCPKGRNENEYK
ncbi:hypothetical protein bpr_II319 (plasmid) [Butyrivibrio proteoclasticus B316]|uniref:Uncharacterized protein n=1 Tax=Butyrivibrio proteoclasticus (strain ATCC 51982 / DSM 14932 / B316) TaxID=515622 RepID=E0S4C4_BUTPB|nr:hypothetical protein [Butyrivibrio proteoclasticus]ADL36256.1 hypothetical protein bpr_II319 [Butyrivibrio proteoclasticus B316]